MNATAVQIMGAAWGTSVFVNQALMALTASQKLHNLVPVLLQDVILEPIVLMLAQHLFAFVQLERSVTAKFVLQ